MNGTGHLMQLANDAARVDGETHARKLHGDGRASSTTGIDQGVPGCAHQSDGIDARVPIEIPVLVQEGCLLHDRRDPIKGHEQTIVTVISEGQAQELAVAIKDGVTEGCRLIKIGFAQVVQRRDDKQTHHSRC